MTRRALALVLATLLAVAAGSGAALAYWRTSGSGSGTVGTGTVQAVTVEAVASGSASTKLIPGGTGDLLVQLSNPNSYTVTITGVAQNGSVSPVGGSGCTGANSGVSVPTQSALTVPVPAGTSVVTIPNAASMLLASASSCQGLVLNIPVTVTVRR